MRISTFLRTRANFPIQITQEDNQYSATAAGVLRWIPSTGGNVAPGAREGSLEMWTGVAERASALLEQRGYDILGQVARNPGLGVRPGDIPSQDPGDVFVDRTPTMRPNECKTFPAGAFGVQ